jgi:metal-responsive CopG/Arc/MetJ family transcriptional regulator
MDSLFLTMVELSDKAERVNITLPARVLRSIDAAVKAAGESRSGFIAHLALRA